MSQDRLLAAADRVEIIEIISRYALAIDSREWDRLGEVFAPGAVVDFTNNGGERHTYPAIVDYLTQALAGLTAYQHYMMNFDIEVRGDAATCRNYVFTPMVNAADGVDSVFYDGGYYDAQLRRTDAGWRITEFVAGLVWLDGEWMGPKPAFWGKPIDRFPARPVLAAD